MFAMLLLSATAPAIARDNLGVYHSWAAFRDPASPRCYAISAPNKNMQRNAYFSIGFWPRKGVTHQIYVRLSRERSEGSVVTLSIGARRFQLQATATEAWAADRRMDLAIVAAIRASTALSVESTGHDGRAIVDAYALRGAPSAIDAAVMGCVRTKL